MRGLLLNALYCLNTFPGTFKIFIQTFGSNDQNVQKLVQNVQRLVQNVQKLVQNVQKLVQNVTKWSKCASKNGHIATTIQSSNKTGSSAFDNLEPVLNRLPSHIIPIIPDIVTLHQSVKNHVWTGFICSNLICVCFMAKNDH